MNAKQAISNLYTPPKRPVLLSGRNRLPKLVMTSADGACAELYLLGGQLTSWVPAGGDEWLFLDHAAEAARSAGRGGMALLFPQPCPDSFAERLEWSLVKVSVADGAAIARLQLADSRASRRVWRHRFLLEMQVAVSGSRLELQCSIRNTGQKPLRFHAALQQYLRLVGGLADARLLGLEGRRYHDSAGQVLSDNDTLTLDADGCERCYPDSPASLLLRDGARTLQIIRHGLPTFRSWNPGRRSVDLAPTGVDTHHQSLRIEAASGAAALTLQPGQLWRGGQALIVNETPLLMTK